MARVRVRYKCGTQTLTVLMELPDGNFFMGTGPSLNIVCGNTEPSCRVMDFTCILLSGHV